MRVLAIVPTHDRTEFISKAVDSVIAQTLPPDELVVIGNVTSLEHPSVPFVYSEDSLSTRLNYVIEHSDCDAFVLLCDDDCLLPDYLFKTVSEMESTNADIVYTEYGSIPVTALIRKSIWRAVGGYCDIGFFDLDFYLSCWEHGAVTFQIREHLFLYNNHPEQISRHEKQKSDGTWTRWTSDILLKHPSMRQYELIH